MSRPKKFRRPRQRASQRQFGNPGKTLGKKEGLPSMATARRRCSLLRSPWQRRIRCRRAFWPHWKREAYIMLTGRVLGTPGEPPHGGHGGGYWIHLRRGLSGGSRTS